jgi:hypothetical protein
MEMIMTTEPANTTRTDTRHDIGAKFGTVYEAVENRLSDYRSASDNAEKAELSASICRDIINAVRLEEEILNRRPEVQNQPNAKKAQVELDCAKILVCELLVGTPDDYYYDAKAHLLAKLIHHHASQLESYLSVPGLEDLDLDEVEARVDKLAAQELEERRISVPGLVAFETNVEPKRPITSGYRGERQESRRHPHSWGTGN